MKQVIMAVVAGFMSMAVAAAYAAEDAMKKDKAAASTSKAGSASSGASTTTGSASTTTGSASATTTTETDTGRKRSRPARATKG
jgi:hypothetical protein